MTSRPIHLFEHLLNHELFKKLNGTDEQYIQTDSLDPADSHERLARYIAREVGLALRGVKAEDIPRRQAEIVNQLLHHLRELIPTGVPETRDLLQPPSLLLSTHLGTPPGRTNVPFSISTVLTHAHGEPRFGHELAREIATADRIDAIISFVKLNGVRSLKTELEAFAQTGRPFRILTTTYIGATDASAIDFIAQLPNAEVRISYDTRRTRLHAKAWLFSRESGLDTAYIGSANLSSAALFQGNEWMMKVSASDLPAVIEKFRGTFETLWNDGEFERYDPRSEADQKRLREALAAEKGGPQKTTESSFHAYFTLKPFPFQAEILDRLQAERENHGRYRNLIVAATGTGKTVLAAFDYQRRGEASGHRPRLLFLAHREEILNQALVTFRHVLRDGAFGALLAGGSDPASHDHLFATIQSFNARKLLERFGPNHWDHVVIDECHHAPAESYRAVVERICPEVLVGLTATPERMDGKSLLGDFGGHIASELRLWHALERQLLVPFEYYGISDNTDLKGLRFSRGDYALDSLAKLYTGDHRRADLIIKQLVDRVSDPLAMRALGFCVSVDHARLMAKKFTDAGIPAIALHGNSSDEERRSAPRDLEARRLNVIFTCDLYNEGVDLPFVDTLLLLRPTSSSTLFMQQLGRGLRLHEKKESCLVLDFIGQHHDDFRFDRVLSAMTGLPQGKLQEAITQGFPTLPSGCHLALDRVAQDQIVASLRRSLRGGEKQLVKDLVDVAARRGSALSLQDFVEETGRDLGEVFNDKRSWTALRRAAGLSTPPAPHDDQKWRSKLSKILHLDEPERIAFYCNWLGSPDLQVPSDTLDRRRILMLAYQMFHETKELLSPETFTAQLKANPAVIEDLSQILEVLANRVALPTTHPWPEPRWPLALHRCYGRREILTAIGHWSESRKPQLREGVLRLSDETAELLFVTLDKSSKGFSPTTSYEDYAISAERFHWQSQTGVTSESASGQRYIGQARNGWRFHLFVRETEKDVFTYLGPVRYLNHMGSRPMSITWEMEVSIPGKWLGGYLRLAS